MMDCRVELAPGECMLYELVLCHVGTSVGDVMQLGLVIHMSKVFSGRLAMLSSFQWKSHCVSPPF